MRTVHKYELRQVDTPQSIGMPIGAEIVHFDFQEGRPMLWAVVETAVRFEDRVFCIVGTGNPVPEGPIGVYIGTAMSPLFVWHLFEAVSS